MPTRAPQWIVVDDSATDMIQYSGPWFIESSGPPQSGNFGSVFQETVHGVNRNASLSFAFTGSRVRLLGSNNLRNDSGVLDPVWECFIDGVSIGATKPFQFPENNWVFCDSQSKISDGSHVLTVNATVAKSQTFWVDQIQYLASASVPTDNLTILVDSADPQLAGAYGPGWVNTLGIARMTGTTGSLLALDFNAISLSWYGIIPSGYPIAAATGAYTIDGHSPEIFILQGLSSNDPVMQYNQKFFQTPTLSPGKHHIVVTFQGNSTTTPLTLDYLVIQNASIPSANTTTIFSASTTTMTTSGFVGPSKVVVTAKETTSSSATVPSIIIPSLDSSNGSLRRSASKLQIEASTGGIIGVITLGILVCLFLRRRRSREPHSMMTDATVIAQPFVWAPVTPAESAVVARRQGKFQDSTQVMPCQSLGGSMLRLAVGAAVTLPTVHSQERILDVPPQYSFS